jgi:sigma-B regulation protein RsbU (phosphoserine phosphatase)
MLRRANGDVDQLQPTAMLLGFAKDVAIEAQQARVEPADRLLLFTDGLSEAMNGKDEEYGEERVKESLARAQALPPPAAVDRLVADVQGFCGVAPPHDDMTLLLVARQRSC